MPLFGRSRRGSSQPPIDRSTLSAATAAAGSAYANHNGSNHSLSSAAAAAALRSQTASPINVGEVQTKRMAARRGSEASIGSGSVIGSGTRGGVGRGGLQRRGSGGSMTERTFRSPSPGRSPNGESSERAVEASPDAPPVPALPKNMRGGGHKRASSLEPPPRVMSPTPRRGGRGASADTRVRQSMPPPATSRANKRLSNVTEDLERQESLNRSVNFSRPMPSPGSSPVVAPTTGAAKKYTHGTGSWFSQPSGALADTTTASARPKTSDGLPAKRAAAGFAQQDVQNAADKPVAKKRIAAPGAQGSHLAQANRESDGPSEVSYDSEDSVMVYDPNTRTFTAKPREKPKEPEPPSPTIPTSTPLAPGTWDPNTRSFVPRPETTRTVSGGSTAAATTTMKKQRPAIPPVETQLEPPPRNPARLSPTASPSSPRAAGFLHKQPSIVREDREAEEAAESSSSSPAMKSVGTIIQTSAGPAKKYIASPSSPTGKTHQRSTSLDVPRGGSAVDGGVGRGRMSSASPQRSAHFSPSPVIEAMKHVPPPRDVSPVKSAMKHGSSPAGSVRANSPIVTKGPGSDVSDTMSNTSQDGTAMRKKKMARVSFDEQPHEINEVGAVATPTAIARERSPVFGNDDEDDDDFKKPRPALPSFGSVRRNRAEMPEKVTEMPPERESLALSSDAALAGILLNNLNGEQRGETTVRVPVPPEVTSKSAVEDDESEEEFVPDAGSTPSKLVRAAEVEKVQANGHAEQGTKRLAPPGDVMGDNGDVPAINLLPPTPGEEVSKSLGGEQAATNLGGREEADEPKPRSSMEAFNVPGGWGAEEDDDMKPSAPATSGKAEALQTPVENKVLIDSTSAPALELHPIDEDSDDSAAFSDAEEEPSWLDDGGFASLDAIVTSPITASPTSPDKGKGVAVTTPESPTTKQAEKLTHSAQQSGDWGEATAYWSKLSKQQREQIERQHMSEDEDAVPAVAKKPRKKKVVQKLQPHIAQQEQQRPAPSGGSGPMPKTMRARAGPAPATVGGSGDGEVHIRRSMRDSGPGAAPAAADGEVHMRRSMRGSGPANTLRANPSQQPRPQSEVTAPRQQSRDVPARPMSSGGMRVGANGLPAPRQQRTISSDSQDSAFPKVGSKRPPQHIQPGAAAPSGAFTAKLQKQVTNDSDSESSFKKKRRGSSATADGRYTMRRSMRAGSVAGSVDQMSISEQRPSSPTPAGRGRGTFSIRSLSPTGGGVFGRGKGEKLRESLRSGSVDAAPRRTTLRAAEPGRSAGRGAPKPAAVTAPAPKSRFKSRFADSDEEDEDDRPKRGGFFKSRFADSDDEDEPGSPRVIPADLTPVRGIPRRQGQDDGDSTELEDEDDDDDPRKASRRRDRQSKPIVPDSSADVEKAMEAARRKLGIPAATNGAATSTVTNGNAADVKQGEALSKGSLRTSAAAETNAPPTEPQPAAPPEKKRRGFMGSLLKRNRNSSMSVQSAAPTSPITAAAPASPQVDSAKAGETSAPSSPSVGKLVRRGSQQPQPKMKRGDSSFSTATAPPTTMRKNSDSWPLPPPVPKLPNGIASADDRPNTSAGNESEAIKLARTMRPDIGSRSQSGITTGPKVRIAAGAGGEEDEGQGKEANAIYSQRTGKKKRFPMLRKAFGLND